MTHLIDLIYDHMTFSERLRGKRGRFTASFHYGPLSTPHDESDVLKKTRLCLFQRGPSTVDFPADITDAHQLQIKGIQFIMMLSSISTQVTEAKQKQVPK